jgi:polyphosphate kinase 2
LVPSNECFDQSGLDKKKGDKRYERELKNLQEELVKLQAWIKHKGLKVVVLFEGRDAAGKGGVIKRITEKLNPRICRVVALGTPSEREKSQWYFQRYVAQLPAAGEMVLFDRSWYNRAGVEKVMKFCTEEEYTEFMYSCPIFEEMIIRSGVFLIKYWFSVSDDVQEKRFQGRIEEPTKVRSRIRIYYIYVSLIYDVCSSSCIVILINYQYTIRMLVLLVLLLNDQYSCFA